MRVDVIDVGRYESRFPEGQFHRIAGTLAVLAWRRDVPGVASHAESRNLSIDMRTAAQCVFVLLDDEDSRTLAHHKTVARLVEGAGGRQVLFVVGRKGMGRIEASQTRNRNRRFRTS